MITKIETTRDVVVFLDTLDAVNMLWHAEDLASECLQGKLMPKQIEELQKSMDEAIQVCIANKTNIFMLYPSKQ